MLVVFSFSLGRELQSPLVKLHVLHSHYKTGWLKQVLILKAECHNTV